MRSANVRFTALWRKFRHCSLRAWKQRSDLACEYAVFPKIHKDFCNWTLSSQRTHLLVGNRNVPNHFRFGLAGNDPERTKKQGHFFTPRNCFVVCWLPWAHFFKTTHALGLSPFCRISRQTHHRRTQPPGFAAKRLTELIFGHTRDDEKTSTASQLSIWEEEVRLDKDF